MSRALRAAALVIAALFGVTAGEADADDAGCDLGSGPNVGVCKAVDATPGTRSADRRPPSLEAERESGPGSHPGGSVDVDRAGSSVGLVANESDRQDSDDLDHNSTVEAQGGGSGVPPPSCRYVPRPGMTRTRAVNSIDDTGLSGTFVYTRVCDDGTRAIVVRESNTAVIDGPGAPPVPPPPNPEDLARELYGEMVMTLPSPTVQVAPADTDPDGWVYVQTPAFVWVDEWAGMSSTLTVGSVSVTLTLAPVRLDVDPGDGGFVSCPEAPPFPAGADPTSFDGCEYVYRHSSAMAPNGSSYPVEASMVWSANWTSNIGPAGSLGEVSTVGSRDLQVAEVQAILVEG